MSREQSDLTGTWKFQIDPKESGLERGYAKQEYDSGLWKELTVPCSMEKGQPDIEWFEGVGWYRRVVHVPEAWQGRRVVLRFEGVNNHAEIWVNGEPVGKNADAFLPFEIPIQQAVQWGKENVIVVKADNEGREGEVPGIDSGWRPFGGILREVFLEATELCYIENVKIVAEPLSGGTGTLSLRAWVRNEGSENVEVAVKVRVADGDGGIVGSFESAGSPLPVGGEEVLETDGRIDNVQAWSPDSPVLYTAHIALAGPSGVPDEKSIRFGFRRIETDGVKLLLNGDPVFLVGFNRHEDSPVTDMCTDLVTTRRDLMEMKAMGCNYIRLCHYPHHPGELDLCDELGLLAMDEIPLYGSVNKLDYAEGYDSKMEFARRQLDTLIRRDWNHPSLIIWSVSNETPEERPVAVKGNDELILRVKELDSSRLAAHVSNQWTGAGRKPEGCFEHDDVLCVNAYPSSQVTDFSGEESLKKLTRRWETVLEELHQVYPDRPILISEFGYWSFDGIVDNVADVETQARCFEAEFAGMTAPYVCGATIWLYADHVWPFSLRRRKYFMLNVSPYGVVTRNRKPKQNAYDTVKRMYTNRLKIREREEESRP